METIIVEIGQLPEYFRLDFSSPPFSRMPMTTYFAVISAREQREFQKGTRIVEHH